MLVWSSQYEKLRNRLSPGFSAYGEIHKSSSFYSGSSRFVFHSTVQQNRGFNFLVSGNGALHRNYRLPVLVKGLLYPCQHYLLKNRLYGKEPGIEAYVFLSSKSIGSISLKELFFQNNFIISIRIGPAPCQRSISAVFYPFSAYVVVVGYQSKSNDLVFL